MPTGAQRWALIATLVLVVVSLLAPSSVASPTSTNTIAVVVHLAGGSFAPAGVHVSLMAPATGQTCVGNTSVGGMAVFFSGAKDLNGNVCWLYPGWYTASVEPQVDRASGSSVSLTILPSASSSSTFYASQTLLNSGGPVYLGGVSSLAMTYTLTGSINATSGTNENSTFMQVLAPGYPGLVLAQGSFVAVYTFTNALPAGTWTLYSQSTLQDGATYTNYTSVTVPAARNTWNISLSPYLVQGYLFPSDHYLFFNQTNETLYDLKTGATYSFVDPASSTGSNYFQFGSYNNLTGSSTSSTQFAAILAPQGKTPAWTYFTASPTNPTQNLQIHVNPWGSAPPTQQSTTLTFNNSFGTAWVNSSATLANGSVIPELSNAAVGDLYAQVGMDFNHGSLNGTPWAWKNFTNWLGQSGPIYPANQANLMVNGTSYTETGAFTSTATTAAQPADLNFTSASTFGYATQESYQLAKALTLRTSSHTFTMGFRYPTATEAINYTVYLPANWVLTANTAVPAGTSLTAAGPQGTWSAFTLTAQHSPNGSPNGSATFSLAKIQNVTAVVNLNSPNFAFSNKTNVFNATHLNYTVLVGAGQNVSFSAGNSVFPAGFNATSYTWNFGDGSLPQVTYRANTTTYHTYTTPGLRPANLTVLANGGQTSVQHFTVLVDNVAPTPMITTNSTRVTQITPSSPDTWVMLNWSQSLRLNATGSVDGIAPWGGLPSGRLSDSIWNISAGTTYYTTNFSIGKQAASVYGNVTYAFRGAGAWMASDVIDGVSTSTLGWKGGWVYNISLTLYDAGGNKAHANLYVLVNDTEKPNAVGAIQGGSYFSPANQAGKNVTSGVALSSGYCPVNLIDKWSFDPHNGSIASYTWNISNKGWSAFNYSVHHSTTPGIIPLMLQVPQTASTVKSAAYNMTLNVTDLAGNYANITYQFTCQLNSTLAPILLVPNVNLSAGTTLTEGQSYTVWVNVTNGGGPHSIANLTHVRFYYESVTGGAQTNISWGDMYGFVSGQQNGTPDASQQAYLHYNVSYRAQISWHVPGGGITGGIPAGQYKICANATAYNEYPGSYKTGANIACTTVTINQSVVQQYFVAIVAVGASAAVLIVFLLYWHRRTKGGSKKSPAGKGKKPAADEDEEDEEEDEEPSKPSGKGGKPSRDDED